MLTYPFEVLVDVADALVDLFCALCGLLESHVEYFVAAVS